MVPAPSWWKEERDSGRRGSSTSDSSSGENGVGGLCFQISILLLFVCRAYIGLENYERNLIELVRLRGNRVHAHIDGETPGQFKYHIHDFYRAKLSRSQLQTQLRGSSAS